MSSLPMISTPLTTTIGEPNDHSSLYNHKLSKSDPKSRSDSGLLVYLLARVPDTIVINHTGA